MRKLSCQLCVALACLLCLPATASIVARNMPVIVYSGPSENSTPNFLLGEGYPLVVISETNDWLTICLHDRTSGYVRLGDTKPGNNVVVLRPTAIREEPAPQSPRLMLADYNLLLASTGEVIDGWLPVRHITGTTGFIPAKDIWGQTGC